MGWVEYANDVRRFWYEYPTGEYQTIRRVLTYQVSDNNWMWYHIQTYSSKPYVRFWVETTEIGNSGDSVYASRPGDTVEMMGDMDTYANQMPGAQQQPMVFDNNWVLTKDGVWRYFTGDLHGYYWPYWPFGWSYTPGSNEFAIYDMACQY